MISCATSQPSPARPTQAARAAVRAPLVRRAHALIRQLLAESSVLAVLGGAAGLLLAWWGLHLLRSVAVERLPIPRLEAVGIDAWVLAFSVGSSLLSGLFFGLVPALSASGSALTDALKEGGRSGSAARGNRTRSVFVVVEVALAVVLLVGAGLSSAASYSSSTSTLDSTRAHGHHARRSAGIALRRGRRSAFSSTSGPLREGRRAGWRTGFRRHQLSAAGRTWAATGFEWSQAVASARRGTRRDVRVVANGYFKAMVFRC